MGKHLSKKNKTQRKKLKYPDVWLVFSRQSNSFGQLMGVYSSEQEAHHDCVGPAFRNAQVVCYSKNNEVKPRREGQGPKEGWKDFYDVDTKSFDRR